MKKETCILGDWRLSIADSLNDALAFERSWI